MLLYRRLIFALILICFGGCSPSLSYQLLQFNQPEDEPTPSVSGHIDSLSIEHDLWRYPGSILTVIDNQSNKDYWLDLTKSHLLVNGYQYSCQETFNNPRLTTASFSSSWTTDSELFTKCLFIPRKSKTHFKLENLYSGPFSHCDLRDKSYNSFSSEDQYKSKFVSFNENESILSIDIRLYIYSSTDAQEAYSLYTEHIWLVSLSNMSKEDFFQASTVDECGNTIPNPIPKGNTYNYPQIPLHKSKRNSYFRLRH